MTLQNRDTTTFDHDDVIIAPDIELDDTDLLLAEDDECSNSSGASVNERIIDDKYNKTLDATQIYLNEIGFSPLLSADFFERNTGASCNKVELNEVNRASWLDVDISNEVVGINNLSCVIRLIANYFKVCNTTAALNVT